MRKDSDIIGEKFGRLTVISPDRKQGNNRLYLCQCDCGGTAVTRPSHLKTGKTKSCGCFKLEATSASSTQRHKMNRSNGVYYSSSTEKRRRLHKVWRSMKERCNNPNSKYYGARGISYCEEWENFKNFYDDMGTKYSDGLTLDRVDNKEGYSKYNCRWATCKQQSRNKSSNKPIEHLGKSYTTLAELAETGIVGYRTFVNRINRGWEVEDALNLPADKGRRIIS